MTTMVSPPQLPTLPKRARGLQARALSIVFAANFIGGLFIFLYFSVIDVSSLGKMRFINSYQTLPILAMPALITLCLAFIYSRPFFEYLNVVLRPGFEPLPEKDGGGRIIHLRRRALRFPIFCALAGIASWGIMGLLIAVRFWAVGRGLAVTDSLSTLTSPSGTGDLFSEGMYISGTSLRGS